VNRFLSDLWAALVAGAKEYRRLRRLRKFRQQRAKQIVLPF
jgi:hypothetical protein